MPSKHGQLGLAIAALLSIHKTLTHPAVVVRQNSRSRWEWLSSDKISWRSYNAAPKSERDSGCIRLLTHPAVMVQQNSRAVCERLVFWQDFLVVVRPAVDDAIKRLACSANRSSCSTIQSVPDCSLNHVDDWFPSVNFVSGLKSLWKTGWNSN